MKTIEQLDADAQQAASKAAAARDAAAEAHAEAARQRQHRIDAWDQQQYDSYDHPQLQQDVEAAEQAVTAALIADPLWSALLDLGLKQRRLVIRWREHGSHGQPPPTVDPPNWDRLANFADRLAHDRAEDEQDQRAAAREAAGQADTNPKEGKS